MSVDFDRGPAAAPSVERTPPQDIAAEQCVLGAMMLSKDAIADVVEFLKEEDFYQPSHQRVFGMVLDLYSRGEPADAITVSAGLMASGDLSRIGGAPYLHTLVASPPLTANASYYAQIVRDASMRRRLVEVGSRIVQTGFSGEGEVEELINRAQAEVFEITQRTSAEDYAPLSELLDGVYTELESIQNHSGDMIGIPTGFMDLDKLTNGLHPGQMIVVAARPAMGKSTLGLDFARACSIKHGLTSAIFSLEMSRNEIVMRLLSAQGELPLHHMRSGTLNEQQWTRMVNTMSAISAAPLFIDDSPNMSMMEIRSKCRRLKQQHDLRMIVVDYLQLMSSGKRVESRQQEVAEFSRALKLLAKELEVPVVAISQLNRGPEQRTDRKPLMSDLRESGSIEQDADVVILLHRDDAYEKDSARPGEADFIVAKHRNGPTATIETAFQGHYSRFVDMRRE